MEVLPLWKITNKQRTKVLNWNWAPFNAKKYGPHHEIELWTARVTVQWTRFLSATMWYFLLFFTSTNLQAMTLDVICVMSFVYCRLTQNSAVIIRMWICVTFENCLLQATVVSSLVAGTFAYSQVSNQKFTISNSSIKNLHWLGNFEAIQS